MTAKALSIDSGSASLRARLVSPTPRIGHSKWLRFALLAACVTLLGTGCAVYPDYGGYYADYGYVGGPWWDGGYGDYWVGGHHGHFGGHHIAHDFGRGVRRGGFGGGGFHGGRGHR